MGEGEGAGRQGKEAVLTGLQGNVDRQYGDGAPPRRRGTGSPRLVREGTGAA